MTTLKTLTIVAALLASGSSLAIAQNGPATGGEPSVAGGANGYGAVPGPGYPPYYLGAPGYVAEPGYAAQGYVAEPGYAPQGFAQPGYVEESRTAVAPGRVATTQRRSMYMYAPAQATSTHSHKKSADTTGRNY
jgi:hypothetical protein